ncbi:MAG: hypothetical protein HYU97_09105 [Deltaproteobacteria bacterium]|nr:hypothetical protein [Deltaproteobacteria bacterium]
MNQRRLAILITFVFLIFPFNSWSFNKINPLAPSCFDSDQSDYEALSKWKFWYFIAKVFPVVVPELNDDSINFPGAVTAVQATNYPSGNLSDYFVCGDKFCKIKNFHDVCKGNILLEQACKGSSQTFVAIDCQALDPQAACKNTTSGAFCKPVPAPTPSPDPTPISSPTPSSIPTPIPTPTLTPIPSPTPSEPSEEIIQLAAGVTSCALKKSGKAWYWGQKLNIYFSPDNLQLYPVPFTMENIAFFNPHGGIHSCLIDDTQNLYCWGNNTKYQLGNGTTKGETDPILVSQLTNVTYVNSDGKSHSCALSNGQVYCWGYNSHLQCGSFTEIDPSSPVLGPTHLPVKEPTLIPNLEEVTSFAMAIASTCALKKDGTVWCWGEDAHGALGNDEIQEDTFTPVQVKNLEEVLAIESSNHYFCALKKDGTVWCWGTTYDGEFGNALPGFKFTSSTPVQIPELQGVKALSVDGFHVGGFHSVICALLQDSTLWCLGNNMFGQLGNGSFKDTNIPTQVLGLPSPAKQISTSGSATCALLGNNDVYCWGIFYLLGADTKNNSPLPVKVKL